MKKKFNVYCTLLLLAFAICQFADPTSGFRDFVRGFNEGFESAGNETESPDSEEMSIFLEPNHYAIHPDTLINTVNGEKVPASIQAVRIYPSSLKADSVYNITSSVNMFIGFIVALSLVWTFITLITSVNRGEIFENQITRNLSRLGVFLLIIYLSEIVYELNLYFHLKSQFAVEGYRLIQYAGHNNMYLYTGLALLAIAQVVKMGKEMKDEQELTI
ncbi:MAG: DUF2975 domain-containing protein [Bacteroidaceae bacterium]|nr:DUF2975 domain-containing protein [Bacteroidaceae bacterium]